MSVILLDSDGQLMISNCLIGSTKGSSCVGIREIYDDTTNQIAAGNTFITNTLIGLYSDNRWTNINIPGYSGAAIASGNKVTIQ
jgi:hypothetical protein